MRFRRDIFKDVPPLFVVTYIIFLMCVSTFSFVLYIIRIERAIRQIERPDES